MDKKSTPRIVGVLLVILSSMFYGTMPATTQKALQVGLSVETILVCRYGLGMIFMWIFSLSRKNNFRIGAKNLVLLLMFGVVSFFCTVAMNQSYLYIPGAITTILVFLYVIVVVLIEIIIGKEKAEPVRFFCMALALIGMVAVVWVPSEGSLNFLGLFFAVVAGILYAISALIQGSKHFAPINAEVMLSVAWTVPALLCIVRCIGAGQPLLPDTSSQWACVIILGLGAGFIGPVSLCMAIKIIGASDASLISTSEPLIAYISGILIMSDHISWNATLGGILITASIFILNIVKRNEEKQKLPTPPR